MCAHETSRDVFTANVGRERRKKEERKGKKKEREEDIPRLLSISKCGIKETWWKVHAGNKATGKPERQGEKLEIIRLPRRRCAGSSTSACSFSLGIGSTGKYAF